MTDSSRLLEHVDFLRGLARGLLRDEAGADDVVQQALVVAMERQDIPDPRLRGWLAGVVRNLVRMTFRGRSRSAARERLVARRDPAPAAAEVVSRMETTRRIVDAVDALEERYRVVVVLRYHDALRPFEIAEKLGVPAATVRTRLHRALAMLRGRLDEDHDDSRGAWALALLPLAWPRLEDAAPAVPSIGGILVKKVAVVMAILLLLLLLGGSVFVALRSGDGGGEGGTLTRSGGVPDLARDEPSAAASAEAPSVEPSRVSAGEPDPSLPEDVAEILVSGADGRPIPGATVTLMRDGFEEFPINRLEVVETRVSDTDGRVRFSVTPADRYHLRVSHPDLCTAGDVTCFGGERTEFLLPKGGALVGTVSDARSSRPVPGATVFAFDWSGGGVLKEWRAVTDEAGCYRVDGIGPGVLNVRVWSPNHAEQFPEEAPRIAAGAETTANFALEEGVRLGLRVFDEETGNVLPEVEVWSYTRMIARGEGLGLRTAPLSTTLPRTELVVRAPGYLDEHHTLTVGSVRRPADPIPIGMTRGILVRGQLIRDSVEPLSGVRIEVRSQRSRLTGINSLITTTDREGRFEIRAVHPGGLVRVMIELPSGGFCWGDEIAVPAGAESLTIPPIVVEPERTLSGRVLDHEGRPVAEERLNGRSEDRDHTFMVMGSTDTSGRFVLRGLPPGPVRLTLWRGPGRATRFLTVEGSGDVETIWRLERGLDIAGRAESEDGAPFARYAVRFFAAGDVFLGYAQLDAEGRFRMRELPPGRYRLEVSLHPESALEDVPAGSQDALLVVTR